MKSFGLSQHVISLILLLLTLLTAKFFSDYFKSEEIISVVVFIALSLIYINILNVLIFLSYNITESPPKLVLRLWNVQYLVFFLASVFFFMICTGMVWNYLEKLGINLNAYPKIIWLGGSSLVYVGVMVLGLMSKAKKTYEALEKINVRVSPREYISVSSDEEVSDWLVVYVYNNMPDKVLEDVRLRIDFPKDVEYYIGSTFNEKRRGTLEKEFNVEPNTFEEIRILPVYVGEENRTAGMIRVCVDTPFRNFEFIIEADLSK